MGQLRTGITNLQQACRDLEPKIKALEETLEENEGRVFKASEHLPEGFNTLVMSLMTKFKKENTTFEAQAAKTLKEVADSNVATFIKGIISAKAAVKATIARLNTEQKNSANTLLNSVNAAKSQCATLTVIAEKKKAKWLKSAAYKAKIGGYLTALKSIGDDLGGAAEAIKALVSVQQNDAWVEHCYKLSVDMKMSEVKDLASIEFKNSLKKFEATQQTAVNRVRQFRDEYKSMGTGLAMMSKWSNEADAMDKEAGNV